MPQFEPHFMWFFCDILVDQKRHFGYNSTYTSKTEQKLNIPNYSMFTDAGNEAVDAIVRSARILKMTWPQVHKELYSLAERFPEDFGEATDTAVRECVYESLTYCTDPFYGE